MSVNNGTPDSATWTSTENRNNAGSETFMVGARYNNGVGEHWYGLIDEVIFYKRVLTANERAWLYNSGQGRSYSEISPPPSNPTTYTYGDPAHKHAVTSLSTGETYTYDANGNMITRVENGLTYTQTFNIENQLVAVTAAGGQTTQFLYDGDGNPSTDS